MIPNSVAHLMTRERLDLHSSSGVLELNKKVTTNFTKKEWFESSKVLDHEKADLLNDGIPVENNILQIAQVVRDFTGKPVYIGSSYRSYEWDKAKGRTGASQHCLGKAVDLNGEDVYELLHVAVMTQNELYKELKDLGANFFGFYSWGVHIDTGYREGQPTDQPMVRHYNDSKKKDNSLSLALLLIPLVMYRKTIFKFIKRLF